jgi:hypothetical protein
VQDLCGACRLPLRVLTFLTRSRSLTRRLFTVLRRPARMGTSAQLGPIRLCHVDAIIIRGLPNVSKGQLAIFVRDVDCLIKTRNGVSDVICVRKRLLSSLRKSEDAIRQVAPLCELAVLLVRLLSRFHFHLQYVCATAPFRPASGFVAPNSRRLGSAYRTDMKRLELL